MSAVQQSHDRSTPIEAVRDVPDNPEGDQAHGVGLRPQTAEDVPLVDIKDSPKGTTGNSELRADSDLPILSIDTDLADVGYGSQGWMKILNLKALLMRMLSA